MAKYSYEFKTKVVQEYLNGAGSYDYLSQEHHRELQNRKVFVNKRKSKKMQKLGFQVASFARKSRRYNHIKVMLVK